MITCPKCQHQELSGALFCSECSTLLTEPRTTLIQPVSEEQDEALSEKTRENFFFPRPAPISGARYCLHILDTGQIIPLDGRKDFSLGRNIEGQIDPPDIDLTSYRAYEKGVSRMHATIQITNQHATVMDMGSANGTRINGLKLAPQQRHPISHGDILTLGKFRIQLLVRR